MDARVSTSKAGDRIVYHLHDDATGASASILPSYGLNLFDLRLPVGDRVLPVVYAAEDFASNPTRPARNGFPILFPFPGRIRNARYTFRGREFHLPANKPPHAIHGFAYDRPWDVLEREFRADETGAHLTGHFRLSKHTPEALAWWPSDANLDVTYSLRGSTLSMTASVVNPYDRPGQAPLSGPTTPDDRPLPWGFGLHSYFRLPLDGRADQAGARVVVPADRYWVLRDSLPTGERWDVEGTPLDYRAGRSMSDLRADDALTDLRLTDGDRSVCRLIDAGLGQELQIVSDRAIREVVVFTPPDTPGVVAVEPYTQMADAFALRELGMDAGQAELPPDGRPFVFEVSWTIAPIGSPASGITARNPEP